MDRVEEGDGEGEKREERRGEQVTEGTGGQGQGQDQGVVGGEGGHGQDRTGKRGEDLPINAPTRILVFLPLLFCYRRQL